MTYATHTCRIASVLVTLAIVGMSNAGTTALAQYPSRPVRLIVPFPAGGQTDIVARLVAQKVAAAFNQPVVVDNRPGGGGTIGTEIGVRATPDGYTLIMVSTSYAANAALHKLPYDPLHDIAPITLVGEIPNMVTVQPSGPARSIESLITYARANPGKLNYASGGIGSGVHLATELFNQMAGTRMTHVPYKGAAAGVSDLISGQIHLIFGGLPVMLPHVRANRLHGIAVTSAKRSRAVPDLPTVSETVPGYEAVSWAAVLGPKALPGSVVARWNGEIERILQLSDVKERMTADGLELIGGPPERLEDLLGRDLAKWRKVVISARIGAN